jgi:hypothetical protein
VSVFGNRHPVAMLVAKYHLREFPVQRIFGELAKQYPNTRFGGKRPAGTDLQEMRNVPVANRYRVASSEGERTVNLRRSRKSRALSAARVRWRHADGYACAS